MQTAHIFESTRDAYDACQCDERVQNGDLLICTDERVVGIAGTWPVAVTAESGSLHKVEPGHWVEVLEDMKADPDAYVNACDLANRLGFEPAEYPADDRIGADGDHE
jgi:hypothetical protein